MDKTKILAQIRNDNDLLAMPHVIAEILETIDGADLRADSLAKVILKDPALTGRLLKFANSPFYSRFSRTSTVHQAIQVLGFSTVKCLALSSTILNPAKFKSASHIDIKVLFSSILSVAVASEKIAKVLKLKASEEAFIAGLLHHAGILFFIHHYPDQYRQIVEHKIAAASLWDAEVKVFGISHAEVGETLTQRWKLPEEICDAIGGHHAEVSVSGQALANVVRLAILFCHDSFGGYESEPLEQHVQLRAMCERLGVSETQREEIAVTILPDTVKLAAFLDLDIGGTEEILMRANREIWRSYISVQHLFREREELSRQLLTEEHNRGAIESKNIAIATLSHYVNNATSAWYGHIQILRKRLASGDRERILETLPASLTVMENAIKKTLAVIAEIKEISPIDDVAFYRMSQAMNIDDRIARRLETMSIDSETETSQEGLLAERCDSNH